jgi:two-component system secretion response regulator SsrB
MVEGTSKLGRVLLADRHLNMLEGVHSLLESLFETVVMVADERSLLEAVEAFKPDLAIVDLSLPVSEGANIVRRLREDYPELRVVVLSVHDEPVVEAQLLTAGVAGYVLKRSTATDLVSTVKHALHHA